MRPRRTARWPVPAPGAGPARLAATRRSAACARAAVADRRSRARPTPASACRHARPGSAAAAAWPRSAAVAGRRRTPPAATPRAGPSPARRPRATRARTARGRPTSWPYSRTAWNTSRLTSTSIGMRAARAPPASTAARCTSRRASAGRARSWKTPSRSRRSATSTPSEPDRQDAAQQRDRRREQRVSQRVGDHGGCPERAATMRWHEAEQDDDQQAVVDPHRVARPGRAPRRRRARSCGPPCPSARRIAGGRRRLWTGWPGSSSAAWRRSVTAPSRWIGRAGQRHAAQQRDVGHAIAELVQHLAPRAGEAGLLGDQAVERVERRADQHERWDRRQEPDRPRARSTLPRHRPRIARAPRTSANPGARGARPASAGCRPASVEMPALPDRFPPSVAPAVRSCSAGPPPKACSGR